MPEPLDDHETSSRVERGPSASDAAFGCARGADLHPGSRFEEHGQHGRGALVLLLGVSPDRNRPDG